MPQGTREIGFTLERAYEERTRGHHENRWRVRCDCGYPLYVVYRARSRRTCTQCRAIWIISPIYDEARVHTESRGIAGAHLVLRGYATPRANRSERRRAAREAQRDFNRARVAAPSAIPRVVVSYQRPSPVNSAGERAFGVELEGVGITEAAAADALAQAGLEATREHYNHSVRPYWKVVYDESVRDHRSPFSRGFEAVSPPLYGADGLRQLATACNALAFRGGRVNRSCGFHVHVAAADMSFEDRRRVFMRYAVMEPIINSLVAPSRRGGNRLCSLINGHAHAIAHATTDRSLCAAMGSRYRTLNAHAFERHGTIEFRQHQGTLEADKAIHWACLCVGFVANGHVEARTSLEGLFDAAALPQASRDYFVRRVQELGG